MKNAVEMKKLTTENVVDKSKHEDRLRILRKIAEFEKNGTFDVDVEDDPPTIPLTSDKVDYLNAKLSNKILTAVANKVAVQYFEKLISKHELIIDDVTGIENFSAVKDGGAIITCNHFNAYDSYALQKALSKPLGKKRLYKVIREGNYTSYGGLYGFFFKHCNTLPLSSHRDTMILFMRSIKTLLEKGNKIIVYPEQAMWWNYRKPRPLKNGAYKIACSNNVPVLPIFITMQDSAFIGEDGFPIQRYTVHILPAIYADDTKSTAEKIKEMKDKNYDLWAQKYLEVYGKPVSYTKEVCYTE